MKTRFYFLFILLLCTITIISCKKGDNTPTPAQVDSLKSALPSQIITAYTYDSSGQGSTTIKVTKTYAVSIKYDTIHYRIDLYLDDTTNTNPYDVLAATYMYNTGGYLTSYKQTNDNFGSGYDLGFDATINRGSDNTISNIVKVWKGGDDIDSIFYTYQAASGGTVISTLERSYQSQDLVGTYAITYNYSADKRLTKADLDLGIFTYTYNANNSLQGFSVEGSGTTLNTTYTYTSGLPVGKADVFLQTLLGKDYYLLDLKELDPFVVTVNSDFEYIGNSITDPYHVTGGNQQGTFNGDPYPASATWTYELNDNDNISKENFTGEEDSYAFRFKY
jgi:hypothetical protein